MWDGDVRLAMRAGVITATLARGFGLTAYRNSGSQLTLSWSKGDSNRWSPVKDRWPVLTTLIDLKALLLHENQATSSREGPTVRIPLLRQRVIVPACWMTIGSPAAHAERVLPAIAMAR